MSSAVRFAAMMPASRAVCSGSPFFTRPERTARTAPADIVIRPWATASRAVIGLALTSTMRAAPPGPTWDSRLVAIALPLRQEKRQALERDRQVHALHLHVRRHLQRPR